MGARCCRSVIFCGSLACVVGAAVYAMCIIASGEGREEVQAVLRRIRK